MEFNHRYQTELRNDYFQAIVINVDKYRLYHEKSGFCERVLQMFEDSFHSVCEVIGAVILPYGITAIINFSFNKYQAINGQEVKNLFENIMMLKGDFGDFEFVIGIGTVVHSLREINFSLQEAFRAEQYKWIHSEPRIFHAYSLLKSSFELDEILADYRKKDYIKLLRIIDEAGISLWFDEMIKEAEVRFENSPEGYGKVKDWVIQTARDIWSDVSTQDIFEEESLFFRQLNHIFDGRKILENLKQILLV